MSWKDEKRREDFWRDYEGRIGEKVLAYTLGRYISGWAAYDRPFWGLLITSAGGFRIHHFPHEGWLEAIARTSTGGEPPGEKTVFIPVSNLVSAELYIEKSWWRKIFLPSTPVMVIRYLDHEGTQKELRMETDKKAESLVAILMDILTEEKRKVKTNG